MIHLHAVGVGIMAIAMLRLLDIAWPVTTLLPAPAYLAEIVAGFVLVMFASRETP